MMARKKQKKSLQTAIWIALLALLLGAATRLVEALVDLIRLIL
jgi:hypothetical protein